jgi:cytochrome c1
MPAIFKEPEANWRFPQMKHEQFMHYIENLMIDVGLEPTREDFSDWISDPETRNFDEKRRTFLQEQHSQGKTLDELTSQLTEDELLDWYNYLDFLVQGRRMI